MSNSKLFQNSKNVMTVGKYLKSTSVDSVGDGIESAAHLKENIKKTETYIPSANYADPENFVKYGSAEKYYKDAFDYITNYYPYDGSSFEKTKFYNDLNPLEKYILEDKYPRSTGYLSIGSNYGTPLSHSSGYFAPEDSTYNQYLQVKGGPYSGTVYSTSDYRVNNLGFCGPSGSTVEFFLKKENTANPAGTVSYKEVVLDLWTGVTSSAESFGRMTILCKSGSQDRFYVTLQSGSAAAVIGFQELAVPTTGGLNIADGEWKNYAFVFANSGSTTKLDFYVNGQCVGPQIDTDVLIGEVTGALVANIGSLRGNVYGPNDKDRGTLEGYGKLSASVDEFRFWKKSRSSKEIGRHWFSHVPGGADKHSANVDLGVYYKFNEGITQTSSVDQIFLDYSGRIANGTVTGYDAQVRNTGSAINELSLKSIRETADPIVRSSNLTLREERSRLVLSGSNYDYTNNARLINSLPSWITENDENNGGELGSLTQIMSSYFDTLFGQLTALRKIKDIDYISGSVSGSINEFPHNDRLIQSLGLEVPSIFENIGSLGLYSQRDEQINFEQSLTTIKNSIYKNIYNNLSQIYKSKGTADAIRNYIRCYGVGENIVSLNAYGDNIDYSLESNYKAGVTQKKYVDFSGLRKRSDVTASVYQYYDSSLPGSQGIIVASTADESAFTIEYEAIFPDKSHAGNLGFDPVRVVTSSLFGFHTPRGASSASVEEVNDLTWYANGGPIQDAGLQVYVVKSPAEFAKVYEPDYLVKDAYFVVKNRAGETVLTSSILENVYEGQKWNLALSVRNQLYPFANEVSGTDIGSEAANKKYKFAIELYGSHYDSGIKRNSFQSTTILDYPSGSAQITSSKRLYMGAHRLNYTGSVLNHTDVHGTSLRYWTDYIPTGTVDLHARDADSYGRLRASRQAYSFQTPDRPLAYIPEIATLALNWDFANITGTSEAGRFMVSDYSSGSNASSSLYIGSYQGGVFSNLNLRNHTGRGDYFAPNDTPVRKEYIYSEKLQLPEYVTDDDMVRVLDSDVETFTLQSRPMSYFFALEKSVYKNVSERMLQMFASIEEFNNLIGEPVNKYRDRYKSLEKLREMFFRNVTSDKIDLQKYVDYYKWLDSSMDQMIGELFPASARVADKVRTVVESHVLERSKISYKYPGSAKTIFPTLTGTIKSIWLDRASIPPGWKYNHAPLNNQQDTNTYWWRTRALRNSVDSPLNTPVDSANQARQYIFNALRRKISGSQIVDAASTVDLTGSGYVDKINNATDLTFGEFKLLPPSVDIIIPHRKKRVPFEIIKDGNYFEGKRLAPFVAISSSVVSGYKAAFSVKLQSSPNVEFANLHHDHFEATGRTAPLQGPFTEQFVGGVQARHVTPLSTTNRKESYELKVSGPPLIGSISSITTGSTPKGQYLRDTGAKSPINIRNIRSTTGTVGQLSSPSAGVKILGNYTKNYEVVQGTSRGVANMDFIFNNASYYTGSIPTAFLTPPSRRVLGTTGSVDYAAPRQISSRRTNQTIIASRFAAPGGKAESKQQFRDVSSDQFSPNSALPFRNIDTRKGYQAALASHTRWGGFSGSSPTVLHNFRTDSSDLTFGTVDPLKLLNEGVSVFGRGSVFLNIPDAGTQATWVNGDTLTLTLDGNTYTATIDTDEEPPASNATTIGTDGLTSGGDDAGIIQSIYTSLLAWAYSVSPPLPFVFGAAIASSPYYMQVQRTTMGDKQDGVDFGGTLITRAGWTTTPLGIPAGGTYYTASAMPYHKTQRNATTRVIFDGSPLGSYATFEEPPYPTWIYTTGTVFDNAYVARPIPQADRSSWFSAISGATATEAGASTNPKYYNEYIMSGSKYPPSILLPSGSLLSNETTTIGTGSTSAGLGGLSNYPWSKTIGFVPWSQLRSGQSPEGTYYNKNNVYELTTPVYNAPYTDNNTGIIDTSPRSQSGLSSRVHIDRLGNAVITKYVKRYIEPPLTSRYKPLVHQIKTVRGTAASNMNSTTDRHTDITLKYSYGNVLMGFANRELNIKIGSERKSNHSSELIKRPYEILRDNHIQNVLSGTDGVDTIKMFAYPETIYPKETNTYLSGTRSRLVYEYSFWKSDVVTASLIPSSLASPWGVISPQNIRDQNRQIPRIKTPFITSQGYTLTGKDQIWHNVTASSAMNSVGGSGSIWPLDSYLYSDMVSNNELRDTVGSAQIAGIMGSLAPGELMMPWHGAPVSGTRNNVLDQLWYEDSKIVSAQYVYSAPAIVSASGDDVFAGLVPGAAISRPAWTAGNKRRYVAGTKKGQPREGGQPFYNSYEEYIDDVKLIGKEYTIVPEYIASNHVGEFVNTGSVQEIQTILELTGASLGVYNGGHSDFYNRYGYSDKMEYLDLLIKDGSNDLIFNKYPKHFEMKTDAMVKLLPYEGFYPVTRTIQLATLFSESYSDDNFVSFSGVSSSAADRWRVLLRPYFAPGIIYNSIKSGLAVDHPVRRAGINDHGFHRIKYYQDEAATEGRESLKGCLSGVLASQTTAICSAQIPGNTRRRTNGQFDWYNTYSITETSGPGSGYSHPYGEDIKQFFWSDRIPFESILNPEGKLLGTLNNGIVCSDLNAALWRDTTGSITPGFDDSLYKKAISNFLAEVPHFFLKKKTNRFGSDGHLTKFVSKLGAGPNENTPAGRAPQTISVNTDTAYVMEIGLLKTDKFNLYNNPYAFGVPTATGSLSWTGDNGWEIPNHRPSGLDWPKHRGEFAPFTPPYYYGPSVARIIYMPTTSELNGNTVGEVSLQEIVGDRAQRTYVEFVNESGSYFDFSSGSYTDLSGNTVSTSTTPVYGWNRAWQNRMDIDASIVIDNKFPTDNGFYTPANPNKWVVMPKWECPILDFPVRYEEGAAGGGTIYSNSYEFSGAVGDSKGENLTGSTQGIWHQYGTMPDSNQGVYLYIKDIQPNERELRLLGSSVAGEGELTYVKKLPQYVLNSGREISSLASLTGFDSSEIMREGFEPEKAKRLGELADDEERTLSEAIIAMPFYLDPESGSPAAITLRANPVQLGNKIKEFRKAFTKYSLPPALARKLLPLVPPQYPIISQEINPFGTDDYEKVLSNDSISTVPVVYMFEHKVSLTQQDLADMWQGLMPEIGRSLKTNFVSIDHYMPRSSSGNRTRNSNNKYPEILAKQIELQLPQEKRTGIPRPDLLDTPPSFSKNGFQPEIKWLVFKVKQKGLSSYSDLIKKEIGGYDNNSYQKVFGTVSRAGMTELEAQEQQTTEDNWAKQAYKNEFGVGDEASGPTYNWPYDYCSLIETAKITTKVGFRPELDKEFRAYIEEGE